ncbi:MAG: HDOD domain-containing protein [Proteobacteria bacterium]|nr:serine/threonine protein kinase [Pseudomonadota bacterium]NOG60031.1 HDOD domain-containing protein [Pseudomonadota bacterium]
MTQNNNKSIGRFNVGKRLGEGMQGMVFLGWDPSLERNVALKVVTQTDGNNEQSQAVINEAKIAAKLSHPNLIPIYEVGMYESFPLLVFEYVDGITLSQYLKEKGALNEEDALTIMIDIVKGLKCAHDEDIMHLDLSPKNIMIDQEGRARIMDFGLARVTVTGDNKNIAGTPKYMSPEHFSHKKLTLATDIFSLGLIFYEMLTGSRAIPHKELDTIIDHIAMAIIDWEKLHTLNISPQMIATIRDMVQREPGKRYQSASDLLSNLNDIIEIQRNEEKGLLSLEFLLRRLNRSPEFPACSTSIAEINRLTEESSNTDFNKLTAVIARDYSLTNRILKISNSVIFDRGSGGVKTISQAISRLGLKLVRMISNGLLLFKQAENKDSDLKDIVTASFVAGLIARHITLSIKRSIAEEAFICALFHNLGTHLLVFYLPDEYEDIKALVENGEEQQKAERKILSTTTASLGKAVAKKWNFPEALINCMERLPLDKKEPINNNEDILRHAANFANELCLLVMSNKSNDHLHVQIESFIEKYQTVFSGDATSLALLTTAAAEKFSDLAPGLGISYANSNFCNHLANFAERMNISPSTELLAS